MTHRLSILEEVSLKVLDELLPHIPKGEVQYIVDLSDLPFTRVPYAVNLLLFLGYLKQLSKAKLILIPPNSAKVVSFLSNMRFFVLAESLCLINKTRPIPAPDPPPEMAKRNILEIKPILAQQSPEGFYNWLGDHIPNTIIDKFSKLAGGRFASLSGVYIELCKNVFEHSHSYGYVAAQVCSSTFQISIGDLGVGILASLEPFYIKNVDRFEKKYGPIWDEAKALDIAFAAGVSSKRGSSNEESGIGLWTVLRAVKQSRGAVICRTGEHKMFLGYQHNRWITERRSKLAYFPGTQLEVYIPIDRSC